MTKVLLVKTEESLKSVFIVALSSTVTRSRVHLQIFSGNEWLDSRLRSVALRGRGREIAFLSLSKAEEGDMKDGAAGEEKKRSE